MTAKRREIHVKGVPICPGIAIGEPYFLTLPDDDIRESRIPLKDVEGEITRFLEAIARSKEDVQRLQRKLKKEHVLEGAAILDAHLQVMQDPLLTELIEKEIRKTRKNAEFVFASLIHQYEKKFRSLPDPYFRDRFRDIEDVSRRVMGHLREKVRRSLEEVAVDSIVFAAELTASDVAEANVGRVGAFVTASGGATSHAAIVAKAKGIPYVTDIDIDAFVGARKSSSVIVDGKAGTVIFNPTQLTLKGYRKQQEELASQEDLLKGTRALSAETIDGYNVLLSANIDMIDELETFHQHGGHGVGLFRSEYIFISNDTFPTEEEQYQIYQRLVKKMKGLPIVIRTFDFGGDKLTLNPNIPYQGNPFLGSREIRYMLKERDLFKAQLRAILRASRYGDVSIMFPMISALSELLEAKEILEEARAELRKRRLNVPDVVRVGCMIEVPSAAIIADLLAKACDFLSIGTNDLVQYSLAVDRRSHSVSDRYAPTDPSVLRMMKLVVCEANQQGIPVTVCGEIAADPRFTQLLLGLGVHELSVSPRYIPVVKRAIRNTCIVEASHLAERALSLTNSRDVLNLLTESYRTSACN